MINGNSAPIHDTYIFDHVQDGILLLDMQGRMLYHNHSATRCLGLGFFSEERRTLAEMFQRDGGTNDAFYQYLLDSVYDKEGIHTGTVPYCLANGQKRILQIRTSFWEAPEAHHSRGILAIFQDITEQEKLKRHRKDALLLLNMLLVFVCGWVILVNGLRAMGVKIAPYQMTYLLLAFGLLVAYVAYKKTDMTIANLGLSLHRWKESVLVNVAVTVVVVLLLVLIKAVLLQVHPTFFPEGQPFWYFRITSLGMLLYPVTVFLQEFIARGILQESLMALFLGEHKGVKATLLAGLLFAAIHVHRSFGYMIGAFFVIVLMSPLYLKYRNIWGVCISHYALCMAAIFLGFI